MLASCKVKAVTLATVAVAAVAAVRARPSQLVAALPSVDGEDGKGLKKFGSIAAEVSPELGCAGQHDERAAEAPIGKVRFPSVGRCVCRSCCRSDLVEGSVSRIGLLCLGSGAGIGALGFRKPIILVRGVSALLRVCLSSRYLRPVLKGARGWCLRGVRFPRRASASAAAAARARRAIGRAFSAFVCGVTRRTAAARSALCAVFGVCGCGAF